MNRKDKDLSILNQPSNLFSVENSGSCLILPRFVAMRESSASDNIKVVLKSVLINKKAIKAIKMIKKFSFVDLGTSKL